jgi:hypothetical protein
MHSDSSPSSTKQHRSVRRRWRSLAAGAIAIALTSMPPAGQTAERAVADSFTATTANMTPAGVTLRVQILEWQEAAARTEVVAALAAGSDAATPLAKLPTVGYVWPNGSPVGYSVKYAHRTSSPDGEEITLVTDRRIGGYDYKPWSVPSAPAAKDLPYSVIVLRVSGTGTGVGNLALTGEVMLDETAGTVAIASEAAATNVLTNVKREPAKP